MIKEWDVVVQQTWIACIVVSSSVFRAPMRPVDAPRMYNSTNEGALPTRRAGQYCKATSPDAPAALFVKEVLIGERAAALAPLSSLRRKLNRSSITTQAPSRIVPFSSRSPLHAFSLEEEQSSGLIVCWNRNSCRHRLRLKEVEEMTGLIQERVSARPSHFLATSTKGARAYLIDSAARSGWLQKAPDLKRVARDGRRQPCRQRGSS